MKRLSSTVAVIITAALLSIGLYLWSMPLVEGYDEPIITVGALRITTGEWPNIDFFANYGPLQFTILAKLYQLFGPSIAIGRLYDSVLQACILVAMIGCMPRQSPTWVSLTLLLWGITALLITTSPLYTLTLCTLLLLLGALLLIRNTRADSSLGAYIPLGIIYALCIVTRYEFSLVAAVAFILSAVLVSIDDVLNHNASPLKAAQRILGILCILGIGGVAALGLLSWAGILLPALRDILSYGAANYVDMSAVPFPSVSAVLERPAKLTWVYVPFLALVYTGFINFSTWRHVSREDRATLLILSAMTAAGILPATVRTDMYHMLVGNVFGLTLLFASLSVICIRRQSGGQASLSQIVLSWPLLFLSGVIAALVIHERSPSVSLLFKRLNPFVLVVGGVDPVPTARLGPFITSPGEMDIAAFIHASTTPSDRIASITGRHDKVFINNINAYFLAGRLPGVFFHQYGPGVQTTLSVQRRMIEDLEANDVQYIVVDTRWDGVVDTPQQSVSSGVNLLDQYVGSHFSEVMRSGEQVLMSRKSE